MVSIEDVSDVSESQLAQEDEHFSQATEDEKQETILRRRQQKLRQEQQHHNLSSTSTTPSTTSPENFPFIFSALIWYLLLPVGVILTGVIAYSDLEALIDVKRGSFFSTFLLSRLFLRLFVGWQFLMKLIFWAALALHVLEASIVAFLLPSGAKFFVKVAWITQTFLLGFASLKPFLVLSAKQFVVAASNRLQQQHHQQQHQHQGMDEQTLRRMMMMMGSQQQRM